MAWYQVKGNEQDVVFSSRIRFARNIEGYAFGDHLTDEKAKEVIDLVGKALGNTFKRTNMEDVTPLAAEALVEQHLCSRDFAAHKGPHALFRDDNKSLSVMCCEEDHIRLQCILPGLALDDAYRFACECDDALDAALPIAFDEKLGYLTHCPTNLGTGLRASVMLFLPALTEAGMIASLSHQLSKLGLTLRGLYGEGSRSYGALYQVSNQVTLGLSEEEILHKMREAVKSIMDKERALRGKPTGEAALRRADRIHRAEGIARYATMLSSEEFFSLFADLKLGVALGEITSLSHEALHAMLIHALPATLSIQAADTPKNGTERDIARAAFLKQCWEVQKK